MSIPIVKADLEAVIGAGELGKYSKQSDANVATAIAQAWDAARSAALNVFSASSFDALTAETLPPEAKLYIVWHACSIVAAGSKSNDEIDAMAEASAKWRGYLVADKVRCFDAVLERTEDRADGAGVDYQTGNRRYDRSANDYWRRPRRT